MGLLSMKKHLRILYGCDDRFELTTRTVQVCRPYFDSIRILNSGPSEFRDRLQKAVGSIEVTQFKQFFEIESCRRSQIKDVPWNEWVMWLDADETPSPLLLAHLDETVDYCEKNSYDLVRYYWSELTEGVHCPPSNIPKNDEEFRAGVGPVFAANRFIKRKEGIELQSGFGAHELFRNVNEKQTYMPYAVHHHKSWIQYYQSVTFSGFMNPAVHYDCAKPLSDILETPEYKALKTFQKKWKTYTSNDLVRKLKIEKNEQYRMELRDLFLSFPKDDKEKSLGLRHTDVCVTFKFMRIFADKYDLNIESPYYPCGKPCCKYGDIQL